MSLQSGITVAHLRGSKRGCDVRAFITHEREVRGTLSNVCKHGFYVRQRDGSVASVLYRDVDYVLPGELSL